MVIRAAQSSPAPDWAFLLVTPFKLARFILKRQKAPKSAKNSLFQASNRPPAQQIPARAAIEMIVKGGSLGTIVLILRSLSHRHKLPHQSGKNEVQIADFLGFHWSLTSILFAHASAFASNISLNSIKCYYLCSRYRTFKATEQRRIL